MKLNLSLQKTLTQVTKIALGVLIISATFVSCKKDSEDEQPTPDQTSNVIEVTDSITSNTTWVASKKYILKGFVYVTNGATLTIEAGTIIKGDKATKGTLIIKRGAKIKANGTASQPIVFTSAQDKGSRAPGDWGGVVICGNAPVNLAGGEGLIEGGPIAYYGGTNPTDNSGNLNYVRIEFGGIALQPNQEINALTLGGVGSNTVIDHIQVSYSGDDAFEMFGGTVSLKNLITYKTADDDLDTDNGYLGKIQYAVILRDPNVADVSGSNGFESDNDAAGTGNTPITNAVFSNISIFGPKSDTSSAVNGNFKRGAHLRRNTKTCIYNSLISGYPVGLLVDGSLAEANATAYELQVRNTIISGCNTPLAVASGSTFDISAWFNTSSFGNSIQYDNSNLAIDPLNQTNPNFLPKSGSPLLTGADFSSPNLAGMDVVTYRGAFNTTNWTSGWSNFNPQNTDY